MSCKNHEFYYISVGLSYREISTKCGNTKHDGSRAICTDCSSNSAKMREICQQEENIAVDNAWAHSAGWGEF